MVGNDFNPASVIWCHNSIGAVAYVGKRVLLKVNLSNCTKRIPRIVLSAEEYSLIRWSNLLGIRPRNK
jgi:hypothetical protein